MKQIKKEIHSLMPKEGPLSGQYAIYGRKYPKYYDASGRLVIPLPIRVSDYRLEQTGDFEMLDDFSVLLLSEGFTGDILCFHTETLDGAWFYTGRKWIPLKHFKPKDLPWNAAACQ